MMHKNIEDNIETDFNNYIQGLRGGREIDCFTILNTAKKSKKYFFTPIRFIEDIRVSGVVVTNTIEAYNFARLADGRFNYIAVDSEKKIGPERYAFEGDLGNIEGTILNTVRNSTVINLKANDITVNAIDIFISYKMLGVPSRKVAILGTGNIGFKLALKLVERGYNVFMYRRDKEKLNIQVDCINLTKPKGTLARAMACQSLTNCLNGVHVVVATAYESSIIKNDDLADTVDNPILIDTGKACFAPDVLSSRLVYRTDIEIALLYQIKTIIQSSVSLFPRFGRLTTKKHNYVCGVSGLKGDIVLKDIRDTSSIIGVCDSDGGLIN